MKKAKIGRPRIVRRVSMPPIKLCPTDVPQSLPIWLSETNDRMKLIGFPTEKRHLCVSDMRLGAITLLHIARRWCLINQQSEGAALLSPRDLFLYLEKWCENAKQ